MRLTPSHEIIGKKICDLFIIKDLGRVNGRHIVEAVCICGIIKSYNIFVLKKGRTVSCGCHKARLASERKLKHGMADSKIYKCWLDIKARCYYKKHKDYHNYGGRGIRMCEEWENDFQPFYNWAIKNGYKKNLTIDRWPDINGIYEPTNCRWATNSQQSRNKRNSLIIQYKGLRKPLYDWCEELNLPPTAIYQRIKVKNWPIEKAFNHPLRIRK